MSWVKVESSVARNRKFVKAGPAASWLWLCGLAYCQEGLTDGFIPLEAIDFLGVKHAGRLAPYLVAAGLWELTDGGWQVHDYLKHNKDAATVEQILQQRRDGGVKGGRPPKEKPSSQTLEVNHSETLKANLIKNPDQIRSDQISAETARRAARAQPLTQPRRKDAAFEYGRLYVPNRAHQDLIMLNNHESGEPGLWPFYEQICEEYTSGARKAEPLPTDLIAFWKAQYAAHWPAAPSAVSAATARRPAWAPKVGA